MKNLLTNARRLGLGMLLIVLASALLLYSDPSRDNNENARLRVAVVNYASVPVLENGEAGLIEGLREEGFVDGRNIELKHYNAEGDRPTAILIAKAVVDGDFDLILTLSTPVLQSVANANTSTQRKHVFTLTTDPWGAGIDISREDPSQHPPYMTGHGTLQPVEKLFNLAREARPDLAKVGVVWNPSESNSEASTVMARAVCKTLNIELIEVTVDNSSAVAEAAAAVINRGAEAIWVGGDSTVASAFDSLIGAAKKGHIPVFTNMPSDVKKGALLSYGADYYEVGRESGKLAARVLRGEDPRDIPVENLVPGTLALNLLSLEGLRHPWDISGKWLHEAKTRIDADGVHEAKRERKISPVAGETYRIATLYFAPNAVTDDTLKGFKKRLAELGFIEGQNLIIDEQHAQGDMSLIPAILQRMDQSDADLIVTHTTPCLTASSSIVKSKPVVFTEVYDPIAAGAGKSATDHLPHVTGVGSFPPLEKMIDTMQEVIPNLRTIGVVYNNAEANSRKAVEVARKLIAERRLILKEATVTNSSEVLLAAQSLTQQRVQVLWEIGDNTVNQSLEALVKAGLQVGIPVINSDATATDRGSLVGVGISFYESGYAAGELAARVLTGEKPSDIPFEEVAVVSRVANIPMAEQLGIRLPTTLLKPEKNE